MLNLTCLLKGQTLSFSEAFNATLRHDEHIIDLKKSIKQSRQSLLREVHAADTAVHCVSVPCGDYTALEEASQLVDQPGAEELGSWDEVGGVFRSLAAKHVHAIAITRGKLPS